MNYRQHAEQMARAAKREYLRSGNEKYLPGAVGVFKSETLTAAFAAEFDRFKPRKLVL